MLLGLVSLAGCSREWYREQADDEVACLIDEKSYARWDIPYSGVDVDARSRYHDPFNPVAPPMPEDDVESHRLMHQVDGRKGWDKWHDNGDIVDLQNPDWRNQLASYVTVDEQGIVQLDLRDAVEMARVNAPNYQRQVETLYLSALDVSTERFRFQTQFFGGIGGGSGGRNFYNNTTVGVTGSETSGRSSFDVSNNTDIQLRRQFATAGELVVGFANSLVWQFSGGDTNFASSAISFAFMQPLLRAGGRQIALETLTIAERTLLANLRAFEHFRQGFYTQIAIGENGTTSPNRRGGFAGSSGLSGFTGQGSGGFGGVGDATGFGGGGGNGGNGNGGGGVIGSGFAGGGAGTVGGFIGLLQQYQQIRNTENSLRAQQQTLQLLEAHLDAGLIDIAQVDQFRQSIETERANLLQARNGYINTLEGFKTGTLGLPPDLPLELKDEMIQQFRFVDADTEQLQTNLQTVVEDFGLVADKEDVSEEDLRGILSRQADLLNQCNVRSENIAREVAGLPEIRELRFNTMKPGRERELAEHEFDRDRERLEVALTTITRRIAASQAEVETLLSSLGKDTRDATLQGIVGMNVELNQLATELVLIQTRTRLETITLQRVAIDSHDALEIARANRFDWMNNRAALVDTWRLIEFNGNRLESNVDIFVNGEMGTIGDNGVRFQPENSTVRAGLRFDAPFNRLVERNNFRAQLIFYQQSRRQLIQYEDGIHRGLRALLRELEQLELNMEIQRRAVAIAIRRVDQTRETLNRPTPPAEPGAPVQQFGPTAALNLLTALSDLRSSQNNFMSVWLNYYADRIRLMRELGILRLDEDGVWIDEPIESALRASDAEMPLPPSVPEAWFHALDRVDAPGAEEPGSNAAGNIAPGRLVEPGTLEFPESETAPDVPVFPAPPKPESSAEPGNEPRALPAPEEPGLPALELPPANPEVPNPPTGEPAENPEAAATRRPARSTSPPAQPAGHWTPTTSAARPGLQFASLPLSGHAQRRTQAGLVGEAATDDSRPVRLPSPEDSTAKSSAKSDGQWRATGKPGSAK